MNSKNVIDPDFFSLEGDTGLPDFMVSMLRIGQIITAKDPTKREITAQMISRWMHQHRNQLPRAYLPKEIRANLRGNCGELRGGGVKIEWSELPGDGSPAWYHFTFSRLYRPEELEPVTT